MVTNISLPQSYVANIQSLRNIEVRSQQEGILQQIYVDEGQMVRAGQPLFRIAIVGEDEEIAKAKSAQEQAEIDLQNTSRLTENNIVSPNARRMAKAKYQSATADYKLAVLHKRLSIIRAPFSGVLGRIPQKVGSFIQQDDLLTTLSDNSKMQVYFNISESDYLDLQQHPQLYMQLPLKLLLANGSTFPARGSIKDISGQFDNATGTISVRSLLLIPKAYYVTDSRELYSYLYRRRMLSLSHKKLSTSCKTASMCSLLIRTMLLINARYRFQQS